MIEIPDCPIVHTCQCFTDNRECVCGVTEKALRAWIHEPDMEPMTPEQRKYCLDEIEHTEGYDRKDYAGLQDAGLAQGVLSAWRNNFEIKDYYEP